MEFRILDLECRWLSEEWTRNSREICPNLVARWQTNWRHKPGNACNIDDGLWHLEHCSSLITWRKRSWPDVRGGGRAWLYHPTLLTLIKCGWNADHWQRLQLIRPTWAAGAAMMMSTLRFSASVYRLHCFLMNGTSHLQADTHWKLDLWTRQSV